ncbi:MAG: hypothetical protein ACI9EW_003510 [Cellvibrionaceae bacterium]|jgi:uncharacterized protein YbjT (DUF2867 family)
MGSTEQSSNLKFKTVLVTGVTGYIGGRLVPRLLAAGYHVRVLVRGDKDRLANRAWSDEVEIVTGNVLEAETLPAAMQGIDVAYYFIHSMSGSNEFGERDRQAAHNFGQAAANASVNRIIYLGGLGAEDAELSEHLRSRHETGNVLRESGLPVTEFRAAIVVGSGSVSFEMIRHLTERVPLMICPSWVYTKVQPIAVFDLLDYLVAALKTPSSIGEIIEIGGSEVLTYGAMMLEYAQVRGLRRKLLPIPLLTPHLSSLWVHLVTPIPAKIAQPLIRGLRNEVIVRNDKSKQLFPEIQPATYRAAVERALRRIREGDVETVWFDAISSSQGDQTLSNFVDEQGMFIENREIHVNASSENIYRAFTSIGGDQGWPPHTWLWQLRGILDRMVGGIGLRRGRRHPSDLRMGDALDFWRVEDIELVHFLLLRAEMKVPGGAWLRFVTKPCEEGGAYLRQTAFFAPKGLWGFLYWYSVYPLHGLVFSGMINNIAQRAENLAKLPLESDSE